MRYDFLFGMNLNAVIDTTGTMANFFSVKILIWKTTREMNLATGYEKKRCWDLEAFCSVGCCCRCVATIVIVTMASTEWPSKIK